MTNNLNYWLAAIRMQAITPRNFLEMINHFKGIKNLFSATTDDWQAAEISEKYQKMLQTPDWKSVENDVKLCATHNYHMISLEDLNYPSALKEISDPPLVLFVRGDVHALSRMQLAIVGSRKATLAGIKNAENFAAALTSSGFAITSGLALGIDGASHRGALREKGITIAVIGSGLKHIYPTSHCSLADKIVAECGAIISEFPPNVPPLARNFPRRNRIIGGLCVGVLVVEAALKSGSLITARLALEQGREVFAIPGSIQNPLTRGCHHLIRQGAKLVETADDILEEFAMLPIINTKTPPRDRLTLDQRQMLNYIGYEITPIDMILLRTRLTASEVSSILLTLELQGHIESVPGGYIRI